MPFLSRSAEENRRIILYPENQRRIYYFGINTQTGNSLALYFNLCGKGIIIILGTADQFILVLFGRRNIEPTVKIKLNFIAIVGKAALRQIVFLTVEVKPKILTRKLFKTTPIRPESRLLIFSYQRAVQTTGEDVSAVYFPKFVLPKL